MDCPICLEKLPELTQANSETIHVPELACNCAFFTHTDCWFTWVAENGGTCLYCRTPIEQPITLVQIHTRPRIVTMHPCTLATLTCISLIFIRFTFFHF